LLNSTRPKPSSHQKFLSNQNKSKRNKLKQITNRNDKININLPSFQVMSVIHWMGYWYDEKGSLSKQEPINQAIHLIFHGILKSKDN